LDACGADAALIALALRCLQPRKEDRPRDAGHVAQEITGYLESVQARLKQAELERATAQARVEEEQKRRQVEQVKARIERQRRRLVVALAAALIVLAAGAGLAGWWYQQEQLAQAQKQRDLDTAEAERQVVEAARQAEEATRKEYLRKEVGNALDQGEQGLKDLQQGLQTMLPEKGRPLTVSILVSDMKQWENRVQTSKAFWQRAQALAKSSPDLMTPEQLARLEQLGKDVARAEADYDIAHGLDSVRLGATAQVTGKIINRSLAAPKFENIFRKKLNLDMRKTPSDVLAKHINASSLRHVLVATLDFWADVTTDPLLTLRLLDVARRADPDPWRNQVRNFWIWYDLTRLKKLARDVQPQQQTTPILLLLSDRLRVIGGKQAAADLLRTALVHHPTDFWLNLSFSFVTDDLGEKVGCYRAALAVRPDSAPVHGNLGAILRAKNDLKGAKACFQKALQLDPNFAMAHNNLGAVLKALGDEDGEIACYRKALELDPTLAGAHINLGNALFKRKDMKEAIACYKKALKYEATSPQAHYSLGRALYATKDLDGAIPHLKKAVALDPKYTQAHYNLGAALALKKDLAGAIARFKKTLELDPNHVLAHFGMGNVLREKHDLDGAIRFYRKAAEVDPKYAPAHVNLGSALSAKGNFKGAIACFRKAIALDTNLAEVHCSLGQLLIGEDQLPAALEQLKIGHKLGSQRPDWHRPSDLWVEQCEALLDLDKKWTAIQKGEAQPSGPSERLALAELCQKCKKQYVAAAKLYDEAFTVAPHVATDLPKARRYNAACTAALAAAGQGKDAAELDTPAKAKLRQQALAWLKADLELWRQQAASGQPVALETVLKKLSHWQTEPGLASVRDEKALTALPEAERKEWQSLWVEVDKLFKQVKE
jgi:tetratricopeptide (TPR) repeat protein